MGQNTDIKAMNGKKGGKNVQGNNDISVAPIIPFCCTSLALNWLDERCKALVHCLAMAKVNSN